MFTFLSINSSLYTFIFSDQNWQNLPRYVSQVQVLIRRGTQAMHNINMFIIDESAPRLVQGFITNKVFALNSMLPTSSTVLFVVLET